MTDRTDIPLDTARKPSITYSEVSGLNNGVGEKQLLLTHLVVKAVKSAAVFGQELSFQIFVFKSEAFELQGQTLS